MAEKRAAAEFAVGDAFQADILLQLDDVPDRAVLDLVQLIFRNRLVAQLVARLDQLVRAQQAADMIGAKRRTLLHGLSLDSGTLAMPPRSVTT